MDVRILTALHGPVKGCTPNLTLADSDTPFGGNPKWNGKQSAS